ncbi:hypothetical protein GGI25_000098 [Coemansia spiralis]|uniref:OCRE domain-containing protein n=2 Tax=Coemansia TaxID=4863 RepID=A0A9W8G8W6_9FUNG|nr:hypothetical protein EDC05_002743 [Coemansia umbellata]KAJ2620287.1 hypothetical protein GGI26_005111 [Coemansia sp. RSA 1358]KAJ2681143.1 hypothetical protein GGI25_000098 [Coemansia spiralis]
MSGSNVISLVPDYASSSDSDSESEVADRRAIAGADANINNITTTQPAYQSQRELGTKLSSILPPPKNRLNSDTYQSKREAPSQVAAKTKKIRIVVDLPQKESNIRETATSGSKDSAIHSSKPDESNVSRNTHPRFGGLFSELSSLLPAPKNSGHMPANKLVHLPDIPSDTGKQLISADQPKLIPHSLTKKQKAKASSTSKKNGPNKGIISTNKPAPAEAQQGKDSNSEDIKSIGSNFGDKPLNKQESVPFFTIGGSEPDSGQLQSENEAEAIGDNSTEMGNSSRNTQAQNPQETEMCYDPTSGYYYDYASGIYYYYDPDTASYIDARSLYQEQGSDHMTGSEALRQGDNPSSPSSNIIDNADLERLIGRGALKREDAAALIGTAVKDLSQSSLLSGSSYSDIKAGASFASKRAAEKQRHETRRVIDGGEVDKKKKQKHNIMYLALQAQEQESQLQEAHANRKSAKRAARAKYGM